MVNSACRPASSLVCESTPPESSDLRTARSHGDDEIAQLISPPSHLQPEGDVAAVKLARSVRPAGQQADGAPLNLRSGQQARERGQELLAGGVEFPHDERDGGDQEQCERHRSCFGRTKVTLPKMRLTVEQARSLASRAMRAVGHDAEDARLIADHLIDCELRGVTYGGLARAISIAERVMRTGVSQAPIRV